MADSKMQLTAQETDGGAPEFRGAPSQGVGTGAELEGLREWKFRELVGELFGERQGRGIRTGERSGDDGCLSLKPRIRHHLCYEPSRERFRGSQQPTR